MKVLVLNAGSSSLKFTLFNMENGENTVLASGQAERLGLDNPKVIYKRPDGYKSEEIPAITNHAEALQVICKKLVEGEGAVLKSLSEVSAIGHRVLHGGEEITKPVLIDENAKAIIRKCFPLGPLHNPANLTGIEACEKAFPGTPNVGVFDTEFHQTMPREAYLYAIPMEFYKKHSIRKYGFHGTSHNFVAHAAAEFLGQDYDKTNLITCHLGNGCSMAAVKDGKCIDTTMGLTPLEGLVMGTRSGDLDPAVVINMMHLGMTADEIDKTLNKKSGLLGVAGIGSGDMRDVEKAASEGNEDCKLALNMFVRRVAKYIGSYYVLCGRTDAIVFTGGVGEHSSVMRKRIIDAVAALGIKLDEAANKDCFGKKGLISAADSPVKVVVMPTNEELMIALETVKIVSK